MPVPSLIDIPLPRHPQAPIMSTFTSPLSSSLPSTLSSGSTSTPSVKALIGRISQSGPSFLVTAGSDRIIRYWDFTSPHKCFVISGLSPAQPKPTFDTPTSDGPYGRLFVSYDSGVPSPHTILQAQLPLREGRGPQLPSPGFNVRWNSCLSRIYLSLAFCQQMTLQPYCQSK